MTSTQSVLLLVSEAFFQDRITTTLNAVGREPILVNPEQENFVEGMLSQPSLGVVIDLEDQGCDAPAALEALRADERSAGWHFIVFSAHEDDDLIARGLAAGVEVIPRSTFAANLVRLMQDFRPAEEA